MRGKRAHVGIFNTKRRLIPARAGKTGGGCSSRTGTWAHPRACGENAGGAAARRLGAGSSPRVRGKPSTRRGTWPTGRLIPARAGKTPSRPPRAPPSTAHPRACGENEGLTSKELRDYGSSPRVRGKRPRGLALARCGRLIPARAGKTCRSSLLMAPRSAHPRACGENVWESCKCGSPGGSSPRVRGKLEQADRVPVGRGLIPARAGKTVAAGARWTWARAHPRACGENDEVAEQEMRDLGSSPRVRGKPVGDYVLDEQGRLIPARAGKTSRSVRGCGSGRAHPRACGENLRGLVAAPGEQGSSPRVRGKLVRRAAVMSRRGLIPARAGKTGPTPSASSTKPAHPRACGENGRPSLSRPFQAGSSPRVRGKRPGADARAAAQRLIPARAGKTRSRRRPAPSPPAHPRACGENEGGWPRSASSPGSSPRVRGKLPSAARRALISRLIPARAGKTRRTWGVSQPMGAHPRACGENVPHASGDDPLGGSSPRVRGKRRENGDLHEQDGLIPARAGKTRSVCGSARVRAAHPRACGENRGHAG